jgi:hypothetical protein
MKLNSVKMVMTMPMASMINPAFFMSDRVKRFEAFLLH